MLKESQAQISSLNKVKQELEAVVDQHAKARESAEETLHSVTGELNKNQSRIQELEDEVIRVCGERDGLRIDLEQTKAAGRSEDELQNEFEVRKMMIFFKYKIIFIFNS